jgi:hypothetical protein
MEPREKKILFVAKAHHVCYKHNSLVDFSFMDENQSANARKFGYVHGSIHSFIVLIAVLYCCLYSNEFFLT